MWTMNCPPIRGRKQISLPAFHSFTQSSVSSTGPMFFPRVERAAFTNTLRSGPKQKPGGRFFIQVLGCFAGWSLVHVIFHWFGIPQSQHTLFSWIIFQTKSLQFPKPKFWKPNPETKLHVKLFIVWWNHLFANTLIHKNPVIHWQKYNPLKQN